MAKTERKKSDPTRSKLNSILDLGLPSSHSCQTSTSHPQTWLTLAGEQKIVFSSSVEISHSTTTRKNVKCFPTTTMQNPSVQRTAWRSKPRLAHAKAEVHGTPQALATGRVLQKTTEPETVPGASENPCGHGSKLGTQNGTLASGNMD